MLLSVRVERGGPTEEKAKIPAQGGVQGQRGRCVVGRKRCVQNAGAKEISKKMEGRKTENKRPKVKVIECPEQVQCAFFCPPGNGEDRAQARQEIYRDTGREGRQNNENTGR